MRRLLPVALIALALPLSAAAATHHSSAAFSPKTLAGTWKGTWMNETFHTSGTLTLKISGTSSMVLTAKITGNTFGCTAPGPQKFTIPKGSGATGWSSSGFKISATSKGFGSLKATYTNSTGKIVANGSHVTCSPGLTFKVTGKWTKTALNATANIHLGSGGTAKTVVKLTKQ